MKAMVTRAVPSNSRIGVHGVIEVSVNGVIELAQIVIERPEQRSSDHAAPENRTEDVGRGHREPFSALTRSRGSLCFREVPDGLTPASG